MRTKYFSVLYYGMLYNKYTIYLCFQALFFRGVIVDLFSWILYYYRKKVGEKDDSCRCGDIPKASQLWKQRSAQR